MYDSPERSATKPANDDVTTVKTPTIDTAIMDQARAIDFLIDATNHLADKIAEILSPDTVEERRDSLLTPTRDDTSIVYTRIVANTDKLNILGRTIDDLKNRVNLG